MLDYDKLHIEIVLGIRALQKLQESELTFRQTHEAHGATTALSELLIALERGDFDADPTPLKDIKVKAQNIVRRNDPETSFKAAIEQTSEKRQRLYALIYAYMNAHNYTDDELVAYINRSRNPQFSPSGVRTRRSEMVKAGWVRDSGKQRDSFAGHPATVWELVPQKTN